ncbi:MAG TPA: GGDEF domain-containing protein [Candidatus Deferrimicrobium sp.]|nr:GGDEF domain-containing protein [Candidatus Deferrimicrobium sp.]
MSTVKRIIKDTEEIAIPDFYRRNRKKTGDADENLKFNIAFTVIQGSEVDFGKHFNFSTSPILIGREKSNDISLDDEKVSKVHCEVSFIVNRDLEQLIIKDLQSTNGTFVNREIIHQAVLKSGDKIGIGDTVIRFSYNDDIEEQYHSKLFTFAATDALTGLYNRRYTINELDNQSKIARRNNRIFSVVIIDIDDFKHINDTYGHLAGDDYLKKFAYVITRTLREQDICGRIGGEEFLVILPETTLDGAVSLANRIREQIEKTGLIIPERTIKTTISAGVSQFGRHAIDSRELLKIADLSLQKAKSSGKNTVVSADTLE